MMTTVRYMFQYKGIRFQYKGIRFQYKGIRFQYKGIMCILRKVNNPIQISLVAMVIM